MTDHLGRWMGAGMAAVVGLAVLIGAVAGSAVGVALGGPGANVAPDGSTEGIPPGYLVLYRQAAATCPGLSWTVLAAIGAIESGHGTSNLPGVHSGANAAGAQGPMQFLPDTFARYVQPVPPGGVDPPSPYDPADAIYAAARLLCANGARDGTDLPGAVYAYNHAQWYVAAVLAMARQYATSARGQLNQGTLSGGW